jgi:hypothetical protein
MGLYLLALIGIKKITLTKKMISEAGAIRLFEVMIGTYNFNRLVSYQPVKFYAPNKMVVIDLINEYISDVTSVNGLGRGHYTRRADLNTLRVVR